MLRGLRRRFGPARGAPLATFVIRAVAVSPFEAEPEDDKEYRPALIVESAPEPGDPSFGPGAAAIGVLLFVEWAQAQLGDATLPLRLRALLPRLRAAVAAGRVGPEGYARHRATQRERYFNHREAAAYAVGLHRDEAGLYAVVGQRIARGRWTAEAALLEAATVAPYEALLRLDPPPALALLAWLERAVQRWLDEQDAGFPVTTWDPAEPPAPPVLSADTNCLETGH